MKKWIIMLVAIVCLCGLFLTTACRKKKTEEPEDTAPEPEFSDVWGYEEAPGFWTNNY